MNVHSEHTHTHTLARTYTVNIHCEHTHTLARTYTVNIHCEHTHTHTHCEAKLITDGLDLQMATNSLLPTVLQRAEVAGDTPVPTPALLKHVQSFTLAADKPPRPAESDRDWCRCCGLLSLPTYTRRPRPAESDRDWCRCCGLLSLPTYTRRPNEPDSVCCCRRRRAP